MAGVGPLVQHLAGDVGQREAGRIPILPRARRGEVERTGSLAPQDEEQAVDQDQSLAPEPARQSLAIGWGKAAEVLAVGRVVEHALEELLDGAAGLVPQVLGDL